MNTEMSASALAFVDKHQEALIDLTKRLIAASTPNPPGNEKVAAEVAEAELHQLGLPNTQIVEAQPERANLICQYETGRTGRTLILNGHLDTKPPDPIEAWETNPYEGIVKDGRLYGLGAADMKGPDAALIYGLAAAVHAARDSLSGKVVLALSADEEGAAEHGARYLVQNYGITADAALIAEPCGVTEDWEALPLISRGITCLRFNVHGTQTHSSISDRVPVINANLEASRLLVHLFENLKLTYPETPLCPLGPTVNLATVFTGGAGLAKIAGEAVFLADIRTLPGMSQAQLTVDINAAIDVFREQHPKIDINWSYFDGHLAWTQPTEIKATHDLVKATQFAADIVLGEAPPLGYFPGGTDAIWWQGAGGIPTIPGFGPGLLPNCHTPNEYVSVKALIEAAKMYALIIMNFLGGD